MGKTAENSTRGMKKNDKHIWCWRWCSLFFFGSWIIFQSRMRFSKVIFWCKNDFINKSGNSTRDMKKNNKHLWCWYWCSLFFLGVLIIFYESKLQWVQWTTGVHQAERQSAQQPKACRRQLWIQCLSVLVWTKVAHHTPSCSCVVVRKHSNDIVLVHRSDECRLIHLGVLRKADVHTQELGVRIVIVPCFTIDMYVRSGRNGKLACFHDIDDGCPSLEWKT